MYVQSAMYNVNFSVATTFWALQQFQNMDGEFALGFLFFFFFLLTPTPSESS